MQINAHSTTRAFHLITEFFDFWFFSYIVNYFVVSSAYPPLFEAYENKLAKLGTLSGKVPGQRNVNQSSE